MPKITAARLRPEEQAVILAATNYINGIDGIFQEPDDDLLSAFSDLLGAVTRYQTKNKPKATLVEHDYVTCEYCGHGTLRHKILNGTFYCHNDNKVGLTCYEQAWIKVKANGGSVI